MSAHVRAASGLSPAARVPFDHQYAWKDFLSYGCSMPLIAPAFGGVRIAYGALMVTQGLIETINLYAKKRFSLTDFPANIPEGYVSGPGMMLLQGAQHIGKGILALNYWYVGLISIVFEKVFKNQIPTLFTASPMMDPHAIKELGDRLKQHSLYKRIEASLNELRELAFRAPAVEEVGQEDAVEPAAAPIAREVVPIAGEPSRPGLSPTAMSVAQNVTRAVGGMIGMLGIQVPSA